MNVANDAGNGKKAGAVADVPFYGGGDKPSHAMPGEVWCLVTLPPVYKTVGEEVMVAPASFTCETIPAEYETVSEKVCVSPAKERCINIPAEYRTETYTETVCAARTEWREIPCSTVTLAAGEKQGVCFGLVTIPEVTKECSRQVLVTPASTKYETIPAEFKTVEKTICVKAEATRRTEIPARFETRTKEVCVSSGQKVWRLTDCIAPVVAADCSPCKVKVSAPCSPCKVECSSCDTGNAMYENNYKDGYTSNMKTRVSAGYSDCSPCKVKVARDCSPCKVKVARDCSPCKVACSSCDTGNTMTGNSYKDGYTSR
jgi:hypothetical protein